jgi:hypothetical protein
MRPFANFPPTYMNDLSTVSSGWTEQDLDWLGIRLSRLRSRDRFNSDVQTC